MITYLFTYLGDLLNAIGGCDSVVMAEIRLDVHGKVFVRFLRATALCCKRAYAIAIPSVRPSVCPSHGWISQKRLKLGSCNFHLTVAPSL